MAVPDRKARRELRRRRYRAVAVGLLAVSACAGDDDAPDASDAAVTIEPRGDTPRDEDDPVESVARPVETVRVDASVPLLEATAPGRSSSAAPPVMTVTIDLDPAAVWADGTPITAADFECSWRAAVNTPGSIVAARYARVTAVRAGAGDRQVVVELGDVYGGYKTLFDRIVKAAAVEDCDDVSADFAATMPVSGRRWRVEAWSPESLTLVPNEAYWGAGRPTVDRLVVVPLAGQGIEVAALAGGLVDVIAPQFGDGLLPSLAAAPRVAVEVAAGGDFEGLYFQLHDGPFADPVYRAAFARSIDVAALHAAVYEPILAPAGITGGPPSCGPMAEGPYCAAGTFAPAFDPAAAEAMLTAAGWARDPAGFWARDGAVPEVRFMVTAGNARRERAQDILIWTLGAAGFRVVADNCDASCVFDQRLPTLDYDLTMYISPPPADPTALTPRFTCDGIPNADNDFQGQNHQGWCNEAASAALHQADATLDAGERAELVRGALAAMAGDDVVLPLAAIPAVRAWRTDRVGGPVAAELATERPFGNVHIWTDVNGDGQIVIGAGGWPACLNPVTACADNLWYGWTIASLTLPSVWEIDTGGAYRPSALVRGEPVVTIAG